MNIMKERVKYCIQCNFNGSNNRTPMAHLLRLIRKLLCQEKIISGTHDIYIFSIIYASLSYFSFKMCVVCIH